MKHICPSFMAPESRPSQDPDSTTRRLDDTPTGSSIQTKMKMYKSSRSGMCRTSVLASSLFLSSVLLLFSGAGCCEAFIISSGRTRSLETETNRMVPQTKPSAPETLPNILDTENDDRTVLFPPSENEKTLQTLSAMQAAAVVMENNEAPSPEASDESSDEKGSETPEASSEDSTPEDTGDEESAARTDEETISARQVALYRSGVLKKSGPPNKRDPTEKKTSVGDRRIGSATQARRGLRRTTQLVDVVRQKAQGIANKPRDPPATQPNEETPPREGDTKARLSTSRIHSTVEELMRKRRTSTPQISQADRFTTAISSWGKTMGILGDEGGQPKTQVLSESPALVVRVASPLDDVDIANLRLSVFSDFSPEMQSQFCFRSCQALAHRRTRGAICVVATPPPQTVRPVLLGSAECSYHEFTCTRLGRRRPRNSLLYITEVAVHPSARRQGIGAKLLGAMDTLASQKGIETLFLHVDVSNHVAMTLYEKCGYQLADSQDPIYREFTTSLNLQPGATRGRTHHLLYKNIRVPTWVEGQRHEEETRLMGSLGFEIPG